MKEIKEVLQERFHCSDEVAERVQGYLQVIEPELQEYLNRWLADETDMYFEVRTTVDGKETVKEYEVEGYTLTQLMKEYEMQFPGALLTLDGLLKDPELTKHALEEGLD